MERSGRHVASLHGAADIRMAAQVLVLVEAGLRLLSLTTAALLAPIAIIVVPALPVATTVVAAISITAPVVIVVAATMVTAPVVTVVAATTVTAPVVVIVAAAALATAILVVAAVVIRTFVVAVVTTASLSRSRVQCPQQAQTNDRRDPEHLHVGGLLSAGANVSGGEGFDGRFVGAARTGRPPDTTRVRFLNAGAALENRLEKLPITGSPPSGHDGATGVS